jgi:hypothetical protein
MFYSPGLSERRHRVTDASINVTSSFNLWLYICAVCFEKKIFDAFMILSDKLGHFGTKSIWYHYLFFWGKVRAYLCDHVVQADWDTDMN